jgi:CRP-like cAMP-binding protein
MAEYKLYEALFSVNHLPNELKDSRVREELISVFDSHISIRSLKRNQVILTPGYIADQIYFLEEGTARGYFYDDYGREHTLYMWDERSIITDSMSYFSNQPTDIYIEVSQNSILVSLSREKLEEIMEAFPYLAVVMDSIFFNDFLQCRKRIMDLISLNPVDRYNKLTKSFPKVELKFPQQDIASYLGTSRQTLSRSKRG